MTKATEPPTFRNWDYLWTLEKYHLAIENGTLTEDDKVELLYGKIVELMPIGSPHAECVNLLSEFFIYKFGRKYRYRQEKPVTLPKVTSEPGPDLVVVVNKKYGQAHPAPGDIHFIAEVSESSLAKDRSIKVEIYAEANLTEYWIINLVNRQIEVYLNPEPEQKLYGSINHYKETETFTSPFAGEVVVAELLPDAEEDDQP